MKRTRSFVSRAATTTVRCRCAHVRSPPARHRAARLCCEATAALAAASGGAPAFEGPAWNGRTVDLIRLAKAHCGLVLHRTFAASVRRLADEARRPRPGF